MRRAGKLKINCIDVLLAGLFIVFLSSAAVHARESDDYFARGKKIKDSMDIINFHVSTRIDQTLRRINKYSDWDSYSCQQVVATISSLFKFFVFHKVEYFLEHDPDIDRVPKNGWAAKDIHRQHIYAHKSLWTAIQNSVIPFPMASTINLNGVYLGTDKVGHFFASGWRYYQTYVKALKKNKTDEQALLEAIDYGIAQEKSILGNWVTGIFSPADLEANFRGLLFFRSFCYKEMPRIEKTSFGWIATRAIDLREYINPLWDESYNVSFFKPKMWAKISKALDKYCPLTDDPQWIKRKENYIRNTPSSLAMKRVAKMVERGELPFPHKFKLKTVCELKTDSSVATNIEPPGE